MKLRRWAAFAIFAAMGTAPALAAPSCADLSLPAFPACERTRSGIIFAATATEAKAAASAAEQGEASFSRHVAPVSAYAVLVGKDVAEATAALRRSGYKVILPWLNADARHQALEDSIRRATEARLRAQGLSDDKVQAGVAQALAQVQGQQQRDRLLTSYSAVAHELGHLWLMEAFWGNRKPNPGGAGHYGGPGPDWLDEAVAIAMEDEVLTAPRRQRFRDLWAGRVPEGVKSLAGFFAMDHPLKGVGSLVRSSGAQPGSSGVMVLTGEEVQKKLGVTADAGPNFYAQARAVADFLIERSGNPKILGEISADLARGRTMEQWVAANGRRNKLGKSMRDLEKEWRRWGEAKFGG